MNFKSIGTITEAQRAGRFKFIKADHKNAYHYIDLDSITHIEAAKNYVIIHVNGENEQFVTYMGLNHVEAVIDPLDFIRINKSFIVAKKSIKKVEGHTIKLKNGKVLQLGSTYKPAFTAFLNESLLKVKF